MGIFSFAALSIVGLLAAGLHSVQTSSTSMAMANINRSLRADLQAAAFTNIAAITATNFYFTTSGYPTTVGSSAPSAPYYTVTLSSGAPSYPTGATTPVSANAYNILVSTAYPYPANSQSATNSFYFAQ